MANEKGVLIVGEMSEGAPASVSHELLGVGRKLADSLGEDLSVLIIGNGIGDGATKELIAYGADKVYVANDPLLADFHPDSYSAVAEKVARDASPNILIMGRTEMGQDVAPRLAFRFRTSLLMDCVGLTIDQGSKLMVMERGVYGGNATAVLVGGAARPQMATVRPKTQSALERNDSRSGEIIQVQAGLDNSVFKSKIVEFQAITVEGVSLESAELVVSGGRGFGSPEAYQETVDVCAELLGAAAGASKAACDAGYAPPGNQVGLTGKRVSPNLYIAICISGASQHIAGMGTSKHIIAVNKDPEANIFKVSRWGVVADYKQVMPAFIQRCKELLEKE